MKVSIKKMDVEMELKNKGMEFEVRDTSDAFLGDLVVAKAGITWCKGKKLRENGIKKSWEEVMDFFENT